MIDECVVAVYSSLDTARDAVHRLTDGGFPADQISLVTLDRLSDPEVAAELKLRDDSIRDAAVGAGLGSVLGLLTGLTVMASSGLGLVFLVGPVGGGIMGGIAGGYFGALSGWGVHERLLEHYRSLVEHGSVLVIANGDPLDLAHAYRLLCETANTEIHTYARTGDEDPETARKLLSP